MRTSRRQSCKRLPPRTMSEPPRVFSPEYYLRLYELEDRHWWSIGMREIERRLLRPYLAEGPLDILDAGCGSGVMLGFLDQFSGGQPVTGVDSAHPALTYCRKRGHARVLGASVMALPFVDRSFDLVHSGDVLQHLPVAGGPERALAEAYRVLKPSGFMFLRTNARRRGDVGGDDYQRFDSNRLRVLVRSAGFEVLAASPVNFLGSLAETARDRWFRPALTNGRHASSDPGLTIELASRQLAWRDRLLGLALRAEAWSVARLRVVL